MRMAYTNIIDSLSAGSILASTEADNYGIENIQDQQLVTQWHSDTTTTQSVLFTLPTFPEIPDNLTAASYISNWSATVDGWSAVGSGATCIVTTGSILRFAKNATALSYLSKTVTIPTGQTIMVKVRVYSGAPDTAIFNMGVSGASTVPFSAVPIAVDGSWNILRAKNGATAITAIKPYLGTDVTAATYIMDFAFVYAGTGEYTSLLADNTSNGNNATVYNCLPIQTTVGSVLSGNGVNDSYFSFTSKSFLSTDSWSISYWIKENALGYQCWFVGDRSAIHNVGFDVNDRLFIRTSDATINTRTGAITRTDLSHMIVEYNNGTFNVYRNNELIYTLVKSSSWIFSSFLSGYISGSTVYPINGYMSKIKLYKRILNSIEKTSLYNNTPFISENYGIIGDWTLDKDYQVNTLALLGHNLLPKCTVLVQASNTIEWSFPEIDQNMTIGPDVILYFLSQKYSYKYWKFVFSGQASLEIGRLWLGEYITIDPSSKIDFRVIKRHSDNVIHGKNRQKFASVGEYWRRFEFSFPLSNEAMLYKISNLFDYVGNHSSFIFCNFDTVRDYALVEPCYVSIENDINFNHEDKDKFTYELIMEEEK